MNSLQRFFCVVGLCAGLSASVLAAMDQEARPKKAVDYDYLLPWAQKGVHLPSTAEAQAREPFQLFDNVYYVGPQSVSMYLIKADKGLILIDSAYDYTAETELANIRKLGFDPKDIKYILITHGHSDHTAGVKKLQAATGAHVGMAAGDWDVYANPPAAHPYEVLPRDLVFQEGDNVTVGNTTIHLHQTPANTPGCLSMEYTVYDHGKPYEALTLGGTGFNFPAQFTQLYIDGMKRMRALPNVRVLLPDHPQLNDVFETEAKLQMRKPGEPNPFVQSRPAVVEWFDTLIKAAEEKQRLEKAAAGE
ncbi:MAG: MBL fold metallo-hydrolase [Candidatus Acidiferrales bacterium]|jgi:metallo-beta-lactamase class B